MAILETKRLKKYYRMGKEMVHALDGVDLRVDKGEFISILGPSGSGKTTLLNMIGCLDKPTEGQVLLDGVDVTRFSRGKLTEIRSQKIGFVFQEFDLIPTLTAVENVMLPLKYQGVSRGERKMRARDALEKVGLEKRLRHRPAQLSGGEQQRVAVARALVTHPEIILADEPTGELDSHTGEQLIARLRKLNQETNQTFIFVTHDSVLAGVTDRQIRMTDGKIVSE